LNLFPHIFLYRERRKKRNIIIKGLNVGEGEIEEKIKKIMGRIEVVKIEKIERGG